MGNRENRAADRLRVVARGEVRYERTVDLEHVDRKPSQVTQARVARAKIVDREPYPDVFQLAQALSRCVRVLHQRSLRELELDQVRRNAVVVEHPTDLIAEAGLPEVHGRDVDGDSRKRYSGIFPMLDLTTHLLDDPNAQRNDVAAFLGYRDELVGRNMAARWVIPAQQGLDGVNAMVVQAKLRLVLELELIVGDRGFEIRLEPVIREHLLVHARREELETVASPLFGSIHRDVCVVEQRQRICIVDRINGYAQARRDGDLS